MSDLTFHFKQVKNMLNLLSMFKLIKMQFSSENATSTLSVDLISMKLII